MTPRDLKEAFLATDLLRQYRGHPDKLRVQMRGGGTIALRLDYFPGLDTEPLHSPAFAALRLEGVSIRDGQIMSGGPDGIWVQFRIATSNPGRELEERAADAVAKYEEFHRYPPTIIGEFSTGFAIPRRARLAGDSKWVTYRSGKVDPSTLKRPRKPVDYIHEHDAGVKTYTMPSRDFRPTGRETDVPRFIVEAPALTRLGENLGFCFVTPEGRTKHAETTEPLPDLYTTPCGKALLVIQDKREVLALMWGGALGVFARGIDG